MSYEIESIDDELVRISEVGLRMQEEREARWGGWRADGGGIWFEPWPGYEYWIELGRLVEWDDLVYHVSEKTWATDTVLAGLVRCVRDNMGAAKSRQSQSER